MIVPGRELMPVIRAALERGQRVRMTVTGSSMWPFVRDGDLVELEPLRAMPRAGDVLLAQCQGERYVLHRAVRVGGEEFYLRGDAQPHCEGPFTQHDVLGRATTAWSNGRARALDHGAPRLAGVTWAYCGPHCLRLVWVARGIRGMGCRALRGLQGVPVLCACAGRIRVAASREGLDARRSKAPPSG